jgi:hypothetical protein
MLGFIWNLRGWGHPGRRGQLKEYLRSERVDFVGLQETIKAGFFTAEL